MQGLRVLTRSGAAPTAEEITAAHVVANTHKEMTFGTINQTEQASGVEVEYHAHKNTAFVSGGGSDYIGISLGDPLPYYAAPATMEIEIFSGQVGNSPPNTGFPTLAIHTRVYSDGTSWDGQGSVSKTSTYATVGSSGDITTSYSNFPIVSGFAVGSIFNGAVDSSYVGPPAFANGSSVDHIIQGQPVGNSFNVTYTPDAYFQQLLNSTPDILAYPWETTSEAAARRLALNQKHSGEVIRQMSSGAFSLPGNWDYNIKRQAPRSTRTYRPILMSVTYQDAVISDTSIGLTQAGTKITRRSVSMSYTSGPTVSLNGTLTQTVTLHTRIQGNPNGGAYTLSRVDTYDNWYAPGSIAPVESLLPHQFLQDSSLYGLGLFWSGAYQAVGGYHKDSTFGVPQSGLTAWEFSPTLPAYFNTLAGTAPEIILQYRRDVSIQYDREDIGLGSVLWNDSAMSPGMVVTLIPFGPVKEGVSLGMFADYNDYFGASQLELFGSAEYRYDYASGALIFRRWLSHPLIVDLPPGVAWSNASYKMLIKYSGLRWPDVVEAAKKKDKQRAEGGGDRFMNAVLDALKVPLI